MYCVREKDGKFLTGFSQQTSMDGIGIANVLACPELNYTSSQLEEVLIANEDFEKLIEEEFEADKTYAEKRREEYPTIEECVHAILDDELDALQIKRKAVKDKYPKE